MVVFFLFLFQRAMGFGFQAIFRSVITVPIVMTVVAGAMMYRYLEVQSLLQLVWVGILYFAIYFGVQILFGKLGMREAAALFTGIRSFRQATTVPPR